MKIIFAQGNPGVQYNRTRHNTGFMIIEYYANLYKISWHNSSKFDAQIAELLTPNEKVLLIKPNTFYNNSGSTVSKIVEYYKIDVREDLLVIHDELMLPFGTLRLRSSGRDAGNNGIKSIISNIGNKFHRIKVGIENDNRSSIGADEFVLGTFSQEESKILRETIIPQIAILMDDFVANNKLIKSINLKNKKRPQ